jgi:hypothetical protein
MDSKFKEAGENGRNVPRDERISQSHQRIEK